MNSAQIVDVQEDEPMEKTFTSVGIPDEKDFYDPFDDPDVTTIDSQSGEIISWYDWLADSATTSHIINQHNAFKTYTPFAQKREVCGVGNIRTHAEGREAIELVSRIQEKIYTITLEDVLYIPTPPNSLLSLE